MAQLRRLVASLVDAAEEVGDTIVPSYTHLQQAQAVPLAHHLLAYAWMLLRDVERFEDAIARIDVSPLGAGASGGSSLPLDPACGSRHCSTSRRSSTTRSTPSGRATSSPSTRSACAQAMVHLSRLAEELILWATTEFGWATFDDRHTTGSSALPQKKNPDIAELARGKAATVIGDVTALAGPAEGSAAGLQPGSPGGQACGVPRRRHAGARVEALTGMIAVPAFHPPPPSSWVTALDLAEVLVERGVPFREAHEVVGGLVAMLVADGRTLSDCQRQN